VWDKSTVEPYRSGVGAHMASVEEKRNVYKVLVGKPEGRRPFGRPRRRWDDEIGMDLGRLAWWVRSGFSWLCIGIGGWRL
jgi:hypothetical protein